MTFIVAHSARGMRAASVVDNFRWRPPGFTLADITHKNAPACAYPGGVSHFRGTVRTRSVFPSLAMMGKRAAFGAGLRRRSVGRDSG